MRKELKKTIDQPRDVEGQIRSALQTPMKRNTFWIITESDYDREVYERFFNDSVVVKPSLKLIRRERTVRMPNGKLRHPVDYYDATPGTVKVTTQELERMRIPVYERLI